jgi:hypothetical protein
MFHSNRLVLGALTASLLTLSTVHLSPARCTPAEARTDLAQYLRYLLIACSVVGMAVGAPAQPTAREVRGAAPVVPLASEPAARLVVDPPLPESLAQGRVVIQYRTENLRILPVYGPAALDVSPRIGHLHITVDSAPWRWLDASNEPIIVNKLPPGPHHILIELVDPTHRVIEGKTIHFTIPEHK